MIDAKSSNPRSGVIQEEITSENVVAVFLKYGVPEEPDLVSIDVDSCDIFVFLSLTSPLSPFRPRVVQIEFNGSKDSFE